MEQSMMEDLESFLTNIGVGRRPANDLFFENTYKSCKVFERMGVTVEDDEELCHEVMKEFLCSACAETFKNLLDYELHYHETHHFVCSQCKKWRPTARLLEIHVQEVHDNFFKLLAEKQPMYQCFVSKCDLKFKDSDERREHCREIHKFPKHYRFDEPINIKSKNDVHKDTEMDIGESEATKKKDSKIYFGKNKPKAFSKKLTSTKNVIFDTSIKTETKLSPVTMFVPRQVQQKAYAKILTNNQQMETNVLESGSLMELVSSLPSN